MPSASPRRRTRRAAPHARIDDRSLCPSPGRLRAAGRAHRARRAGRRSGPRRRHHQRTDHSRRTRQPRRGLVARKPGTHRRADLRRGRLPAGRSVRDIRGRAARTAPTAAAGAVLATIAGPARSHPDRRAGGAEFPGPSVRRRHGHARRWCEAVEGTKARIVCTRKTTARAARACRNMPCAAAAASITASAWMTRC